MKFRKLTKLLSEADVASAQHPRTGRLLLMAGAVGLSPDYSRTRSAGTVVAAPRVIRTAGGSDARER